MYMRKRGQVILPSLIDMPALNYIWVGDDPAKEKDASSQSEGVIGHDTQAVIQMAKKVKPTQRIVFWCLDNQVPDYQRHLSTEKNIQVRSIEKFIEECMTSLRRDVADAAKKINEIMNKLLLTEGRNSIRDKVTVKEFFAFFVLKVLGGYTLDTNVMPQEHMEVNFPKVTSFCVPLIHHYHFLMKDVFDIWMMAAQPNDPIVNQTWDDFYLKWQELESTFSSKSEEYYNSMVKLAARSINSATEKTDKTPIYWQANLLPQNEDTEISTVNELGIVKKYYKTHAFKDSHELKTTAPIFKSTLTHFQPVEEKKVEMPDIFIAAAENNVTKLSELIVTEDVNQKLSNHDCEGETPLFLAVRMKKLDAAKFLLENGAEINVTVKYKGHSKSLNELISEISEEKERSAFAELLDKHKASKRDSLTR